MTPRICIVCAQSPTDVGGIQTVVRDLIRFYTRMGYEVHVCTGVQTKHVKGYGNCHSYWFLRHYLTEFLCPLNLVFTAALTVYLCFLQRRYRFEVLIPQDNYLQGLAASVAGKISGCRTLIMDHGVVTNISDPRWQAAWRERHDSPLGKLSWPFFALGVLLQPLIFRLVCQFGDRFFYTGYELEAFYDTYHVPESRRRRYDHIVDHEFFSPPSPHSDLDRVRKAFDIPPGKLVLSCTSRINFEKGYPQIVAAFHELVQQAGPDVILAIAGDTGQVYQTRFRSDREKKALLDFLADKGLLPQVRFLGALNSEEIRDLHRVSDLHIYAGTMGCSFSLSVLEAMSCALPCVVTPVPQKLQDVITPDIGWVVPPGEVAPLAKAFIDAYKRWRSLNEMGARARTYVLAHNTDDVMRDVFEGAIHFAS